MQRDEWAVRSSPGWQDTLNWWRCERKARHECTNVGQESSGEFRWECRIRIVRRMLGRGLYVRSIRELSDGLADHVAKMLSSEQPLKL